MSPGMTATVTSHSRHYQESVDNHSVFEGVEDGVEHEFTDVINIETHYPKDNGSISRPFNWRGEYKYPRVTVATEDGELHEFESAVVDVSDTEPALRVHMVKDKTASGVMSEVRSYNAYGLQSQEYENELGGTSVSYSIFLESLGGKTALLTPVNYRGFIVSADHEDYPKHFGTLDRHSKNIQLHYGTDGLRGHPVAADSNTFQIETPDRTYNDVEMVTRPEPGRYHVRTAAGNVISVDSIEEVSGGLFTVVARHETANGYGETVTAAQRALGVYRDASSRVVPDGDERLVVMGHPHSGGTHKTPGKHGIASVDDIQDVFIKTPDGTIHRGIDAIPEDPYDNTE